MTADWSSNAAAGWYEAGDAEPGRLRYWDGTEWTERTALAESTPNAAGPRRVQPAQVWGKRYGVMVPLVLAVVAVVGLGVLGLSTESRGRGSSSADSRAAVTDTSNSETVETLDPEQQCVEVVMRVLSEVPQALSEGYNAGIDPSPLITQYGTEGRVFNAFVQGQALLMGKIASEGDPDRQLASVLVDVDEICHDDGRFDDAPAEGLSGLQ